MFIVMTFAKGKLEVEIINECYVFYQVIQNLILLV